MTPKPQRKPALRRTIKKALKARPRLKVSLERRRISLALASIQRDIATMERQLEHVLDAQLRIAKVLWPVIIDLRSTFGTELCEKDPKDIEVMRDLVSEATKRGIDRNG